MPTPSTSLSTGLYPEPLSLATHSFLSRPLARWPVNDHHPHSPTSSHFPFHTKWMMGSLATTSPTGKMFCLLCLLGSLLDVAVTQVPFVSNLHLSRADPSLTKLWHRLPLPADSRETSTWPKGTGLVQQLWVTRDCVPPAHEAHSRLWSCSDSILDLFPSHYGL